MNDKILDPRIKKFHDAIIDYTNSIYSICDYFQDNFMLLQRLQSRYKQDLLTYIKDKCKTQGDNLIVSPDKFNEAKLLISKSNRANKALRVLPQSLVVAMVSQYDSLVSNLIRLVYEIFPEKLYSSEATITYKQLFSSGDLEQLKNQIIEDKIETTLRKPHEEQLKDMSKLINNISLDKFSLKKEFIEITQRRNLFVHCNGKVSKQYIDNCANAGIERIAKEGDILEVDEKYFNNAFYVLFCVGIMLAQTIIRVLLDKDKSVLADIDSSLNNVIYEAIFDEKYNIAIYLSEFATSSVMKHSCQKDVLYFILNQAQAYKWAGNEDKCRETLAKADFSAVLPDFQIAKLALEENIDELCKLMKMLGKNGSVMTAVAYASWAIFKQVRSNPLFQATYEAIFGEPLNIVIEEKVETLEQIGN